MNDERPTRGRSETSGRRPQERNQQTGNPAPAIVITFPLESPPSIALIWNTDEDDWRMTHWLDANPQYAQVVYRACELAEEAA